MGHHIMKARLGILPVVILPFVGCLASHTIESVMPTPELTGLVFANDGGPLLILSRDRLDEWRGAPDDDVVGGDYGRAIESGGLVSLVTISTAAGVVLGNEDMVYTAQWIMLGDSWLVAGWLYGEDDSESKLLDRLRHGEVRDWHLLASNFPVEEGLVLFHPACRGEELSAAQPIPMERVSLLMPWRDSVPTDYVGIGDALVAHVTSGTFSVDWARVEIDGEAECIVCRWRPKP